MRYKMSEQSKNKAFSKYADHLDKIDTSGTQGADPRLLIDDGIKILAQQSCICDAAKFLYDRADKCAVHEIEDGFDYGIFEIIKKQDEVIEGILDSNEVATKKISNQSLITGLFIGLCIGVVVTLSVLLIIDIA